MNRSKVIVIALVLSGFIASFYIIIGKYERIPIVKKNIIYIVTEGLRAQHLQLYGYAKDTSPVIDKFARQSMRFLDALSPSPSLNASQLKVFYKALESQGYSISEITLGNKDTYNLLSNPSNNNFHAFTYINHRLIQNPLKDENPDSSNQYDVKVKELDQEIGTLFQYLKDKNIYNDTIIVLAAKLDGEYLEKNSPDGRDPLLNPEAKVPLLLKVPAMAPGKTKETVSLIDIYPTLLEVIGAPAEKSLEGVSMLHREKLLQRLAKN